jgi:hypothetical protein
VLGAVSSLVYTSCLLLFSTSLVLVSRAETKI